MGRAVFFSIGIMSLSYLLFSYATVTGFDYDVSGLGAAQIPFVTVAQARSAASPSSPMRPG